MELKTLRKCNFGRILKDGETCVFDKLETDVCVCNRPISEFKENSEE